MSIKLISPISTLQQGLSFYLMQVLGKKVLMFKKSEAFLLAEVRRNCR
jgi:hypothetical protein